MSKQKPPYRLKVDLGERWVRTGRQQEYHSQWVFVLAHSRHETMRIEKGDYTTIIYQYEGKVVDGSDWQTVDYMPSIASVTIEGPMPNRLIFSRRVNLADEETDRKTPELVPKKEGKRVKQTSEQLKHNRRVRSVKRRNPGASDKEIGRIVAEMEKRLTLDGRTKATPEESKHKYMVRQYKRRHPEWSISQIEQKMKYWAERSAQRQAARFAITQQLLTP